MVSRTSPHGYLRSSKSMSPELKLPSLPNLSYSVSLISVTGTTIQEPRAEKKVTNSLALPHDNHLSDDPVPWIPLPETSPPFTLTATNLVVVSPPSLAWNPVEACSNWNLGLVLAQFQFILQLPGIFPMGKCDLIIALPLNPSVVPQARRVNSRPLFIIIIKFLLNIHSEGSVYGYLSLCLEYSLLSFTDSSLTRQTCLLPWRPTFCYMSPGYSQNPIYSPHIMTWLRGGKHRHIITHNVVNSC